MLYKQIFSIEKFYDFTVVAVTVIKYNFHDTMRANRKGLPFYLISKIVLRLRTTFNAYLEKQKNIILVRKLCLFLV